MLDTPLRLRRNEEDFMNADQRLAEVRAQRSYAWVNIAFLTLTPPLAVVLTGYYIANYGIHWMELFAFFSLYMMTGFGITAGYHRYFSHLSYQAHWSVRLLHLVFGAGAMENSALKWCRDHRLHHQKVDTPDDPYNINESFYFAHMGWIFYKAPLDRDFTCAPDLMRDPLVRWQDKYYLPLAVFVCFAIPTLLGALVGRPFGGFVIGGLLRVVIVQHLTFCINSLAHYFGSRPYSIDNTARDSWWLAFITYGEGYHNFHHRFAADYRNGYKWYQWDPTKWWILLLKKLGLVTRLTKYSEEHILKARIETDVKRVQLHLQTAPEKLMARLEPRIAAARAQLEAAYARWETAKIRYRDLKHSLAEKATRKQWKLRVREYNFQFRAAQARWALMVAALCRFSGQNPLT